MTVLELTSTIRIEATMLGDDEIEFTLHAPSGYWLGVGLGPSLMDKADIFVVQDPLDAAPTVYDYFHTDFQTPPADLQQDYNLTSKIESAYKVSRPLNTTDALDFVIPID